MALCQPYPFSLKESSQGWQSKTRDARCRFRISSQWPRVQLLSQCTERFQWQCRSTTCTMLFTAAFGLGWDSQDSFFFFPSCQGTRQRNTHGRRDLKEVWMDPHLRGCLCRTCWMLGIPWLLLSTWKAQGPDRQLFSPLPAFPFSSLCSPWKCPFSAFSALSASPSLSSDCSTSGTTQFHGFVSLPLLLVMSGPRAIGIFRLPWKKYHRHFQTPLEKHKTVPDVILSC